MLGLLGLEMVLSFSFSRNEKNAGNDGVAVLIGTPLLTGPGLLTASIILSEQYGSALTLVSLLTALFAAWIILRQASRIKKMVGEKVIDVISRVMGLMLVALAVTFIQKGLLGA